VIGVPLREIWKNYIKRGKQPVKRANDGWPSGTLVHFSPKGIVAVSQYRKAGVDFISAGGPIRAHFWEA